MWRINSTDASVIDGKGDYDMAANKRVNIFEEDRYAFINGKEEEISFLLMRLTTD